MSREACSHIIKLKEKGGIRDYEKILLLFCLAEPEHLKELRASLNITRRKEMFRCPVKKCPSKTWQLYVCVHCVFFSCKKHFNGHCNREGEEHHIGCTVLEGCTFCFTCDDYMFDEAMEGLRETLQTGHIAKSYGNVESYTSIAKLIRPSLMCLHSGSTVGIRGMVNLKNTCYINCVLQVLVHSPLLADFFLSEGPELHCSSTHEGKPCLLPTMRDLVSKFYDGERSPVRPVELLASMWKNAPHLASADQQDAHEFLTAILEGMGRHFLGGKDCAIEAIFYGRIKSTIKCGDCGGQSVREEPFMELSLEVFGKEGITLEQCLRKYTEVERLSAIDCGGVCGGKRESSKQLQLLQSPLLLCMHFKRFQSPNGSRKKWDYHIKFPTHLDLLEYSAAGKDVGEDGGAGERRKIGLSLIDTDYMYSLYAVVSHLGCSEGGHYITYYRNIGHTWFLCDDHIITKVSLEDVLQCQAYMLFYHRTAIPDRPLHTDFQT